MPHFCFAVNVLKHRLHGPTLASTQQQSVVAESSAIAKYVGTDVATFNENNHIYCKRAVARGLFCIENHFSTSRDFNDEILNV